MPTLEELNAMFNAAVEDLAIEFQRAPALLLTEEDLRCQLFARLSAHEHLKELHPTADEGVLGAALHCDISWFDADGRLVLRPDITILEPGNLSITRSLEPGVPFPSKGAHFVGDALVAELKFHRHDANPTLDWLNDVSKDLHKLNELVVRHRENGERIEGVMVVFTRYSKHAAAIESLLQAHHHEVRFFLCCGFIDGS